MTLPLSPDLPLDLRPAEGPHFCRWQMALDGDQWAALSQAAGRCGITSSSAVLAVFVETLGRWCSRRQFTVNMTLQQRAPIHEHVGRVVGDFTSLELLAVDMDSGATFLERARAMQARLWEDLDHQWFSGTQVMRELSRRHRELTMFPIVFTSAIGVETEARRGWGDLLFGITQTPQVWIDCQASERGRGLYVNWDVRDGVFPDGLVDDMFSVFVALLTRAATDISVWDQASPVNLPPDQIERRRLANATDTPLSDALLHEGIVARALQHPERLAVVAADGTLSYGALLARARGLADALAAEGVRPGDLIGIALDKSCHQPVAVLAVLLCGGVYVPVDLSQPPARRNRLLADAGVRVAVTEAGSAGAASWPTGLMLVFVDSVRPQAFGDRMPQRLVSCEAPAYVIYTSGSTGAPKGVVISHASAVNTIDDINRRFAIGPSDSVLGLSSLGFDLSVYDIFGVLGAGGCLVLPDPARRADPSHWAELVREHSITVWNSVPALMQMLHEYISGAGVRHLGLTSLRLALLSGDWIPVRLPGLVRGQLPALRIVSLGGATEAAIWSIFHEIAEVPPEWNSIPYGRPLANQRVYVLDGALCPCPDLVAGEIYIAGAGLAIGYWRDEAKTRERFIVHPLRNERLYRTLDWGRYRRDGSIEFLGREDRQAKILGHRIELAEVEAALAAHPAVAQAAVVVDGARISDRRLRGFAAVPAQPSTATISAADLKAFLNTRLPKYMVPAQLHVVDALPLTANGKIDYRQLLASISSYEPSEEPAVEQPVTDQEGRLAGLWREVLSLEHIGRHQGFLALGGDSLRAARLAGRVMHEIEQARHASFDEWLQHLLNDTTLAAFAALLDQSADINRAETEDDSDRMVTLQTLVPGGQRAALVIADLSELLECPEWQSLWPDRTMLLARFTDANAWQRVSPQSLLAALAQSCVDALIDAGHLRVDVIGAGSYAPLALDVARQIAESGAVVDRLFIVGDIPARTAEAVGTASRSATDHIAYGLAAWDPAPYAGDLTLVLRAGDQPPDDERRRFWETACLGEVTVMYAARGAAV